MFDDSLVESRGLLASGRRRWITVVSFGLQCLIAAVIVIVPMLRPEVFAFHTMAPAVVLPEMKKPPVIVEHVEGARESTAAAPVQVMPAMERAGSSHPLIGEPALTLGEPVALGVGPGMGGAPISGLPGAGDGARVVVAAPSKTSEPVKVSGGVAAGMLLGEIRPVYPRIAVAARVEGVVVIAATISKTGRIESARVVSGPEMLAGSAIEAVRGARYRPYRLNGEATEVMTTITVNFRLGG
jgi:protein TonB